MAKTFKHTAPEVGMGATLQIGSDRYAYTVERVSETGKTLWAVDDGSGAQSRFSLRANGRWGQAKCKGVYLYLGVKENYRDPSF
jgi:hypothetical protein